MKLPVVAAVPNYNMGEQLSTLLPELATQDYADIYVLDDASTDGSREVVEDFNDGSGVHFIAAAENKGAGAARNQIIGALGYDAIIHFMDADITLETDRIPEIVQDIVPSEPFGFVGGLAKTPEDVQSVWNYGPHQDVRAAFGAMLQLKMEKLVIQDPDKARSLRERHGDLLEEWPDPLSKPERRPVFWNIEQNLLIKSEVFAEIEGFDEALREHEIQDLAIRLSNKGLRSWFDPSISVKHLNKQDVRDYNRVVAMHKAEVYIARKHGFRNWFAYKDKFKP